MEFPDLGQNCFHKSCNRLDFLPVKCDACANLFCCDHVKYDSHACSSSYKKNVQVPVCPLCNTPVPVPKGESPDRKVGEHIDRDCQSDPAKIKRKSDAHQCSMGRCKNREFVAVICPSCRRNFCLQHRNAMDHECKNFENGGNSTRNSSLFPANSYPNSVSRYEAAQSSMVLNGVNNEDEALARALHMSLNDDTPSTPGKHKPTREELDRRLAEALSMGDEPYRAELRRQSEMKKGNCVVT